MKEKEKIKKEILKTLNKKGKKNSIKRSSSGEGSSSSYQKIKERFDEAIYKNNYSFEDKIVFNNNGEIILEFFNVDIVTNNVLLRVHNKDIYKYKKSWEKRVIKLFNKLSNEEKEKWDNSLSFSLEFLYSIPKKNFQDIDGLNAALKPVIDGLVLSGIIKNDKQENVPIQIPYQIVGNGVLRIVIKPILDINYYFTGTFKKIMEKSNEL